MVEIIPPTEKITQEYLKERSSLVRSPLLYSIRTIGEMIITGKEAKIIRISRKLQSARHADSMKGFMINITPRSGE